MSQWASLNLQEGTSIIIELMVYFHDYMMVILLIILGFVLYIFILISSTKLLDKYTIDQHLLELFWTLLPMAILLFIAFPSLYLLYLTEDTTNSSVIYKVVGHQWYWEYQHEGPLSSASFDSYIVSTGDSLLRNLDVDNRLCLPCNVPSHLLVTSADVLHSWTVPALGVKADATPGRLNSIFVTPSSYGVWYGQCSELCGTNHSFIPISVESVDSVSFISSISGLSK